MGKRRRFSRQQVAELWDRWCGDESLETIAAALQVSASGAFGEIRRRGGIPPRPTTHCETALTLAERHVIERARSAGTSMRATTRMLGRAPSTISRELTRHGRRTGRRRGYHAATAERR